MSIETNENHARLTLTFPGQGGYDGLALLAAHKTYPQVAEIMERVDAVTRELFASAISETLLADPTPTLRDLLNMDSWVSQIAIFTSSMCAIEVLRSNMVEPNILCGHSLGEISALVAAGAFSLEDGTRIVAQRVKVIDDLGDIDGTMVALGTDSDRATKLVNLVDDPTLAVASANHAGQTVVSGKPDPVAIATKIAAQLEISSTILDSTTPFHTPTLEPAVAPFANYIRGLDQNPMSRAVFSPILGRYYEPDDFLAELLAQHLVQPVRFADAIATLHAQGCRVFVEAGGKSTLTKLTSTIVDDSSTTTLATLSTTKTGIALASTLESLEQIGIGRSSASATPSFHTLLLPDVSEDTFNRFWSSKSHAVLVDVRSHFARWSDAGSANESEFAAASAEVTPPAEQVAAPSTLGGDNLERATLFDQVSTIYADTLEYPTDVFGDDALLEADLGVDSVKQIELLTRVSAEFGVPPRTDSFDLSVVETLDKVVDYLHDQLARR